MKQKAEFPKTVVTHRQAEEVIVSILWLKKKTSMSLFCLTHQHLQLQEKLGKAFEQKEGTKHRI